MSNGQTHAQLSQPATDFSWPRPGAPHAALTRRQRHALQRLDELLQGGVAATDPRLTHHLMQVFVAS